MKFGLESLGIDSSEWKLDLDVEDNYADVLWFYNTKEMQEYRKGHQYHCDTAWQYLDYARAHFYDYPIDQRDVKNNEFPLSYEVGSNAEYFKKIDKDIYKLKLATPHIWGAAEMYMYYKSIECESVNYWQNYQLRQSLFKKMVDVIVENLVRLIACAK